MFKILVNEFFKLKHKLKSKIMSGIIYWKLHKKKQKIQ